MFANRPAIHDVARPGTTAYLAVAALSALVVVAGYSFAASHQLVDSARQGMRSAAYAGTLYDPATTVYAQQKVLSQPVRALQVSGEQRVDIDASRGYLTPNHITVRAGEPVEVVFSEGEGCTEYVKLEALGLSFRLTEGGTVIRLPGLRPGVYPLSSVSGQACGVIVAE